MIVVTLKKVLKGKRFLSFTDVRKNRFVFQCLRNIEIINIFFQGGYSSLLIVLLYVMIRILYVPTEHTSKTTAIAGISNSAYNVLVQNTQSVTHVATSTTKAHHTHTRRHSLWLTKKIISHDWLVDNQHTLHILCICATTVFLKTCQRLHMSCYDTTVKALYFSSSLNQQQQHIVIPLSSLLFVLKKRKKFFKEK